MKNGRFTRILTCRGAIVPKLVALCVFVMLIVRHIDAGALFALLTDLPLLPVAGIVASYGLTHVIAGLRSNALLRGQGVRLNVASLAGISVIGSAFDIILPGSFGGDVVRAARTAACTGVVAKSVVTVAMDRLIGLFVMLCTAALAAVATVDHLPAGLHGLVRWGVAGGCLFLIAAFAFLASSTTMTAVANVLARFRWHGLGAHMADSARQFSAAAVQMGRQPEILASLVTLVAASILCQVCSNWLALRALGSDVPFSYLLTIVPLVTVLMSIPVTIYNLGFREVVLVVLLKPFGIDMEATIAMSLILYFVVILYAALGVMLLFVWPRRAEAAKGGKA